MAVRSFYMFSTVYVAVFKPGVYQPKAGAHLVLEIAFVHKVCMRVCVCVCVRPSLKPKINNHVK